ncbi:VTT domain-containing protein [Chloroflexota bacterium]
MEQEIEKKGTPKRIYFLGILGATLTIAMALAIIYFGEWVRVEMEGYGYAGAFIISIMGGSSIIIPVPMLAINFALGGVMKYPWLVGISAGLGETIGAFIIYMTGHGAGQALHNSKHGKIQAIYNRLSDLMARRGGITLLVLASVVNPFFYPAALTAGATRFGIRKYFLVCLTGKTIKNMTVVFAGYWGIKGILRMLGVTF